MTSYRCPAKVNLFLSVAPPDTTGWHQVRSTMVAISLADTLHIETALSDHMVCHSTSVPDDNTVTRALALCREYVDVPKLRIELDKVIPTESGLGGGSSDAAAMIRAVQHLTRGAIGSREASEIAFAIGADVPFFLTGGTARVEGYGERVSPHADTPTKWLLIVQPPVGTSTRGAYGRLDEHPVPLREFPDDPWSLFNSFESVANEGSLRLISAMRDRSWSASLTGSGSAVYAVFEQEVEARAAAAAIDGTFTGHRVFVARTLGQKESICVS